MWNCATEECGVQCVMTHGMMMMQLWCADSWDTVQRVCSLRRTLGNPVMHYTLGYIP